MRRVVAMLTSSLLALTACQAAPRREVAADPTPVAPSGTPSPTPTPLLSAAEQRVADAEYLVDQMKELHPRLYHSVSKRRFNVAARNLVALASEATAEEFLVEVMRLVALPTLGGRDGHSGLFPLHGGMPLHSYPLRAYDFSDGLFVIDALPPYEDLIGSEIVGVGGTPLATIRRMLYPLITRDNKTTIKARFPTTLLTSEVLEGSGIIRRAKTSFQLVDPEGRHVSRTIRPIRMGAYARWVGHHSAWSLPKDDAVLYLRRPEDTAWVRYLRASKTIYAQYNMVHDPDIIVSGIERFMREGAETVVLDIRHNPGGNNMEYGSLLRALTEPKVDREGHLFVITGRTTFSAAGNLAGEIDHDTKAIFVGEPSGGAPNQFGDQQLIELPHSSINTFVPDYFVQVVAGDRRDAIPVQIEAVPSSADFFGHRDPAMEAILALTSG